jgi:hypothetical protein
MRQEEEAHTSPKLMLLPAQTYIYSLAYSTLLPRQAGTDPKLLLQPGQDHIPE